MAEHMRDDHMSRRRFLQLLSASVGASVLAACGGTSAPVAPGADINSAPTSGAESTSAPVAAAASPAAGGMATSAPATTSGSTSGNSLAYGLGFDVDDTLDPQVTNYDSTIRITLNICEPLVWMPESGKFVPGLAESWEISPDAKEFTFKLKQGVKFHDGTPFNADAVKFTFDRVMDPATKAGQSRDQLGPYDRTEVIDDYTVKVVMKQGFAPLLANLNGYLGIVSPTAVKKDPAGFARAPVGTGPFMFKEWVPKDHVTLVKNPDYNGGSSFFKHTGPAYLDEIVFKIIPEASVRTGALKSGEIQYTDDMDPLEYEAMKSDSNFAVIEKGQPGSGYILLMNLSHTDAPIGDSQVRLAMEYGIDREGLNQSVFQGLNTVAASPLMKPTFGYDPSTESLYPFDQEKAKSILDAAGWTAGSDGIREKNGAKLTIDFPIQARPTDQAMAESIQASLRDIGIDVKVNPLERAAARELITQNKYDVGFMWFSYGDPDVLRTIFYSKNVDAFNRAKYQVPEVDKMLEDAAATTDENQRKTLYAQIQQRVLKDTATVPLVDTITHNAKRAEVQGDYLDALASYVWLYDVQLKK